MGCGCNKRRKRRQQSSRMPLSPTKPKEVKRIGGIKVPENMTPNQRRSTIAKINNGKINRARQKTISECVRDRKSQEG
tara:strand:+ start:290 stop:523 length:234 start_codon:yes stop_codon:yes gene_type:complete